MVSLERMGDLPPPCLPHFRDDFPSTFHLELPLQETSFTDCGCLRHLARPRLSSAILPDAAVLGQDGGGQPRHPRRV